MIFAFRFVGISAESWSGGKATWVPSAVSHIFACTRENTKQTLSGNLFISFEFQKKLRKRKIKFQVTFHVLNSWSEFCLSSGFFPKKLLKWSCFCCFTELYSTAKREAELRRERKKMMMMKFSNVNWANWEALWTFFPAFTRECIKNFFKPTKRETRRQILARPSYGGNEAILIRSNIREPDSLTFEWKEISRIKFRYLFTSRFVCSAIHVTPPVNCVKSVSFQLSMPGWVGIKQTTQRRWKVQQLNYGESLFQLELV